MIVADRHQYAADGVRAGSVGVPHGVHRSIEARRFAVPQPKHGIVPRTREQSHLLRSPNGRRGQVLVDPGLEYDAMFG